MNDKNHKVLSSGETVTLSLLNNGVALICFDAKDGKVNVLSRTIMAELDAALDKVHSLKGVRGLVFISGKEDNFIAGANVKEIVGLQRQSPTVLYEATEGGKAIFQKVASLPYPTVAAINGSCMGGGTELSLHCKHRILSSNPKTRMGLPEVGLGFIPGWGGTVRLPKLIGMQNALELILQPLKTFDAAKASRVGLACEVVEQSALLDAAYSVALGRKPKRRKQRLKARIINWALTRTALGRNMLKKTAQAGIMKETKGNYPAPLGALDVAIKSLTMPLDRALEYESQVFAKLAVGPVSRNLVEFYLSTQDAKKMPEGVKPAVAVQIVGVLGCGVMGSGIIQAAANAGYKVIACDPFPGATDKGKKNVGALFDALVERRKLSREQADRLFGNITWTANYDDMADCNLVIEAIIEDLKKKQEALAKLEGIIKKPFIFATNTSSLSVTEMASTAKRKDLFGGLHFFNPVHKMPLVEVIRGAETSESTVAALQAFAGRIGKTVVISADATGFIVNRVLVPYLFESIRLFEQGVPVEELEKAMTAFGMPMGPLALLDEVGLDTAGHVIDVNHKAFGDRLKAPALLAYLKSSKLLGKKGGKGFYLYDANGKRLGFNPEILAQVKVPPSPRKREEIQDRLTLVMINEAALALAEGVAAKASELDLAMIMGTGFAPFRGGVLRYADAIGARVVVQKLEALSRSAGMNYEPAPLLRELAKSGRTFWSL